MTKESLLETSEKDAKPCLIGGPGKASPEGRIDVIPTMDQAHEVAMRVLDLLCAAGELRLDGGEDEQCSAKRAARAYVAAFRAVLSPEPESPLPKESIAAAMSRQLESGHAAAIYPSAKPPQKGPGQ